MVNVNPLVFAVVLPTLLVAHNVADHWLQTDQAARKGDPGWPGRLACARHVATYTATTVVMVGAVWWLFGLPIGPWWFVAGQAVSAVTHYWADRQFTLRGLCERWPPVRGFYRLGMPRLSVVAVTSDGRQVRLVRAGQLHTGLSEQWDNPTLGTGAYALDQSWHWWWLWVAALVTSVG